MKCNSYHHHLFQRDPAPHPNHSISSIRQHLLPRPLAIDTLARSRKATPPILDRNNLIRTLLLNRNTHRHLMANLCANLEHLTLPTLIRIGAAGIREFKGRGAPELEFQIGAATLVDVDFGDLAAGEADRGDGMDRLCEVEGGAALGGRVAETGDGEGAWELGEAPERGAGVGGFALLGLEGVVDCEGGLAAKGKGEALADAEILAVFEGCGRGCVVHADLDAGPAWWWPEGASTRVADLADGDGRVAEMHLAMLNLEIVLVRGDVLVHANLRLGCTLVLDLDFEIEGRDTLQSDGDDFLSLRLSRAVAVRLARLVKACARA